MDKYGYALCVAGGLLMGVYLPWQGAVGIWMAIAGALVLLSKDMGQGS